DVGFRRLIEHIEPRYSLPSRRHLADVCLPVVANHIHELLATDITAISFTTDIWSSDVSITSMLSLTAQWIDKDFKLQKILLHSQEFRGSHTAQSISLAFANMFDTWHIDRPKVHAIVSDNARNMTKAMEEGNLSGIRCMAHTLQLAVNEGVLAQRSVKDLLADKENPREEAAAHSTGDVTQTTEKRARLSTAEEEEERGQPPSLSDMFNEIMEENTTPNRLVTSSTAQQLDDYLSEVPIPRSENPLGYWRNKQDRFPDLAKVARKYLSAPCTSTDSERLFSAASHVLDEKRNRLMADKAEKLLFIKKNLPLFLNK
ncbi:hypothetical protein JOQ06_003544, partial [Pogonophryne albipinna]